MTTSPPTIRRDRYTLTLDATFVVWGWFLYSFSPSVPLLAEDLGVSKAAGGLHGTAMAVGAITAALFTPRLVLRLGRRAALLVALVTVAVGAVGLVTGTHLAMTLTGMFVLAVGGNIMISSAQVGISAHQGAAAPAAITEANGIGSGIGLFAPLAVGLAVGVGWGWRAAVAATAVIAVGVVLAVLRLPDDRAPASRAETVAGTAEPAGADGAGPDDPEPDRGDAPVRAVAAASPARRLAPGSLGFLVAIIAAMALENATTYWSTALVIERTGADASIATATTAGLIAGMTAMRFVAGPLTRRWHSASILAASFGIAVVGWAVLWTATTPAVAIVGLVVAGLGYGAQYPLSISLLLGLAGERADGAQAVATFAGGAAVGLSPFLLGAAADAVGTHTAFLAIPVLAVAGVVATLLGRRASA